MVCGTAFFPPGHVIGFVYTVSLNSALTPLFHLFCIVLKDIAWFKTGGLKALLG